MTKDGKPQLDTLRNAARDLECDDDPEPFAERLRKLVKQEPVREKAE